MKSTKKKIEKRGKWNDICLEQSNDFPLYLKRDEYDVNENPSNWLDRFNEKNIGIYTRETNDFERYWMILNEFERFRTILNDFERFWVNSSEFNRFLSILSDFERFRAISNKFDPFPMISNDSSVILAETRLKLNLTRTTPNCHFCFLYLLIHCNSNINTYHWPSVFPSNVISLVNVIST